MLSKIATLAVLPLLTAALVCVPAGPADAAPGQMPGVGLAPAWGVKFTEPTCLASDGQAIYVCEQPGTIQRIAAAPSSKPQLFMDLRDRVLNQGQGGLLGIAFHPSQRTRVFVSYLAKGPDDKNKFEFRVSEFTGNNPASEKPILRVPKTRPVHHAGGIGFAKDGTLYVSVGDAGAKAVSEQMTCQDPKTYFGKILRIDVSTPGQPRSAAGNPWAAQGGIMGIIWAYGFRNPWQFDWDSQGRLWTAEPGISGPTSREWIVEVKKAGNHRWPFYEGTRKRSEVSGEPGGTAVAPAFEHPNSGGEAGAYCGGKFYRGAAIPALKEKYVYCDYMRGQVYVLDLSSGRGTGWATVGACKEPASIGRDAAGELYVLSNSSGVIYKVVPKS